MYYDCHVHIGLKKHISKIQDKNIKLLGYKVKEQPINKFVRSAQKNRIFKSLIFPFPFEELEINKANQYIYDCYIHYPELILPVFIVNSNFNENEINNYEVVGFKEHFYLNQERNEKKFLKNYEYICSKNLFLIIHPHMQERISKIEFLSKNFPSLKIILAHSGRKWPFTGEDIIDIIIPKLKKYENIYYDTSTIRCSKTIKSMIDAIGDKKILFGSDIPFGKNDEKNIYHEEINVILNSKIKDKQKENILKNNFKELLLKDVWIRRVSQVDKDELLSIISKLSSKDKKYLAIDKKMHMIKQNTKDENHIFILENKQEIIGFLRESGRKNNGAMIEEIMIKDKYKGNGYGYYLLSKVIPKFNYVEAKTFAENMKINNLFNKCNIKIEKKSTNEKIYYWKSNLTMK